MGNFEGLVTSRFRFAAIRAFRLFYSLSALFIFALQANSSAASPAFLSKMAFDLSTSLNASATASSTSSSNTFCNIWAVAPNYYPWVLKSSDVDGKYVLLHYFYQQAPSALPKTIIFAWHRDGQYAPWIVYYGNEDLTDQVKINNTGMVALWHTNRVSPTNPVAQTHLRVCRPNPTLLNSQLDAYNCSLDLNLGDNVETIPHNVNAPTVLGSLPNQPDGKFIHLDWGGLKLFYTRFSYTNLLVGLNAWDSTTLQTTFIDGVQTSSTSPGELWIHQADSQGAVGYYYLNIAGLFSGGAQTSIRGAAPNSNGVYIGPQFFEQQNNFFGSIKTHGFTTLSGEQHGFFSPTPANAPSGFLGIRFSGDNYASQQLLALPLGQIKAYRPTKVSSLVYGELLLVETWNSNNLSQIEVYSYTPSSAGPTIFGTYTHLETIAPPAPFTNIGLNAGTDEFGSGAAMVQLFANGSQGTTHALINCL